MERLSPILLMSIFFLGLGISTVYGGLGLMLTWSLEGESEAVKFFAAYTSSFKTIGSLGLILGTTLVMIYTQSVVPESIRAAFTEPQLSKTKYFIYEKHFWSLRKTITFVGEVSFIAFIIFSLCGFPLSKTGEVLMMIAVCFQYGLTAYVGRRLIYSAMMLHSLRNITVTRNLFQKRELDEIYVYVNMLSTLIVIFVYIHVVSHYGGPFLYNSIFGENIRLFLVLPAVIVAPLVLVFNVDTRAVLRKLYSQSIDAEKKRLEKKMESDETLSTYEKRSYLMEFEKISRDELRESLKLTLNDLPVGVTILILLLEPFLKW